MKVKLKKFKVTTLKSKIFTFAKMAQQGILIGDRLLKNQVVLIPANTIFSTSGKSIQEYVFVFINVEQGDYDLVVRHKSDALHKSRKLAWAVFEIGGLPINERIAKKLELALGNFGMFSYIGGGRARGGMYHSGTAINVYQDTDFIIIKIITAANEDLKIEELGLIKKERLMQIKKDSKDQSTSTHEISINKLTNKICDAFVEDTYVIYANISPNIADGSSIWLSSITDIIANNSRVILLLKENLRNDIIISNVKNKQNVNILQPSDYSNIELLDETTALNVIRVIDEIHPMLRGVLVRGVIAANELVADRRFRYRSIAYLTDFYEVKDGKQIVIPEKEPLVRNILLHSHLLLIQTPEIKNKLFEICGYEHKNFAYLPPSLPDLMFDRKTPRSSMSNKTEILIGYAGKIMPNWGVEELLDWVIKFNADNKDIKIKLFIAANKISAPGETRKPFAHKILSLIEQSGAEHYKTFNREQCIELLEKMDYVWAFRPSDFEESTLELSTKLLEAAAMQQRVMCYPSIIHKNELGKNYPFYVRHYQDFQKIILNGFRGLNTGFNLSKISKELKNKHAISSVSSRLKTLSPFDIVRAENNSTVCFAGHDFKFIDVYISHLKASGCCAIRDNWEWGKEVDADRTKFNYEKADIIFCEWGLANAVWYSKNNVDNKPLYIRVHAQEVRDRARKFGHQINFHKVTKVIFVTERIRDRYIELFKIPIEKTVVIPNFVYDDEYTSSCRAKNTKKIVLGMVGIVPQLKRLDRAIDILDQLVVQGLNVELKIKGHRPENLEFMKAPSRVSELEYYNAIYANIESKGLSDRVVFDGWGNDVALWYKEVDFILSPSDTESFHYALADGVLSGCIPVVWDWDGARQVYQSSWIVGSNDEAIDYIGKILLLDDDDKQSLVENNRRFIKDRYGFEKVESKLSNLIFQ